MQQNTKEWLEWRKQGIGGSDIAAILGISPWKTVYQLWEEKIKEEIIEEKIDYIKQKGHEEERKARAEYELYNGIEMPPTLFTHTDFSWVRVSMDGYNQDEQIGLEIKYVGKDDFNLAMNGRVPDKYYAQIQWQLFTSGARRIDYYAWNGKEGICIPVIPDLEFIGDMFDKASSFWEMVKTKTPPPLGVDDFMISDDKELSLLLLEYDSQNQLSKEIDNKIKELKEKIINHHVVKSHPKVMVGNWNIQKIHKKGNIDYDKIPDLANIDIEQFRKKGSEYYQILKVKK